MMETGDPTKLGTERSDASAKNNRFGPPVLRGTWEGGLSVESL
jgi:hypothetical protein